MIRILIVSNSNKLSDYLRKFLSIEEDVSMTFCTNASKARRLFLENSYDLIIINYPLLDEKGYALCFDISEKSDASILALIQNSEIELIQGRMEKAGIMAIPKPVHPTALYQVLKFAILTHRKLEKIRKDNGKLNHRIEEIKTINRAKCLLMENGKMSEQDAHRFLEKKAMDTQQTRLQIANAVIRRYHRR
ncbi:ANTAR domain-containing response regulator [Absiella sp. AM29-15]|uniref:ANTAR domain-containing response regulator n=1 Tax=Absiella sp. AM29-15 TaxID=2292278 RepID=UPI000E42470A|nr:ANTAR domain-containing protein [Absiella sp. AM29-15]RGC52019.1 ANTAR domain-containing protein [Absiella sp. AM29-15]